MMPIKFDDKRYQPSRYPGFNTFEEGQKFIRNNCLFCRNSMLIDSNKRHKCDMLHDLRLAMANNYPFWNYSFVKLELREEHKPRWLEKVDPETALLETIISCKKFQSKQLEFAFAES